MKDGTRIIITVSTIFIALCLMLSMTMCNHDRVALIVDAFTLNKTSDITIGKSSDLYYDRVAHDQMKVKYLQDENCWEWSVDKSASDTLPYYKVNNYNPNLHSLEAGDVIEVKLKSKTISFTVQELIDAGVLSGHQSQYVRLADAFKSVLPSGSVDSLTQVMLSQVQSVFNRPEADKKRTDRWRLVVLDRLTTIKGVSGEETGYCYAGRTDKTDSGDNEPDVFKIQFCTLVSNTYQKPKKADAKYFHIGDVNITCKPAVLTTAWGAGHMTLRAAADGVVRVTFPKPITYVERLDTLKVWAAPFAGLLTLTQNGETFPSPAAMLIPSFSNALNMEVCNVEVDAQDKVNLLSAGQDEALTGGMCLVPTPARHTINFPGHGTVEMRAGFIDTGFALSYLWPVLLAGVLLIITSWWVYGVDRFEKITKSAAWNAGPWQHFAIVMLIAMTYCIAKAMIAFKLSYSFPYFEKITAVEPASAVLLLLAVFAVSVLFNRHLVFIDKNDANEKMRPHVPALVVMAVTWLGLAAAWLYYYKMSEPDVMPAVNDSYLAADLTGPVWKWNDVTAINDLHRSVPMTLMLFVCIVAVVQVILAVCNRFNVDPVSWVTGRIEKLTDEHPFLMTLSFLVLTTSVALLPGNFATAFITILVIVLLSLTLRVIVTSRDKYVKHIKSVKKWLLVAGVLMSVVALGLVGLVVTHSDLPWTVSALTLLTAALFGSAVWKMFESRNNDAVMCRVFMFVLMLVAAVLFFAAAVAFGRGDMGYITNFPGFVVLVVLLFLMVSKQGDDTSNDERSAQRSEPHMWRLILGSVGALVLLLYVVVPNYLVDPNDVNYGRGTRRLSISADFGRYMASGYRYAVQDTEFMIVMAHYFNASAGIDPLSNETHLLHSSVSSGQSPVVLNDVSLPAAFLGPYGVPAYVAYFGLIVLLAWLVIRYTVPSGGAMLKQTPALDKRTVWRLLAVLMWVSTTLYLFLSYMGWLPFTGRLNPGYGVDAVGEALESAILLAFMTATSLRRE